MSYTEEELQAAVASATKELEDKVRDLESAEAESLTEAKIAEVRAELEGQLEEIRQQLDAAVSETESAKNERDAIVAWLEGEQATADEKAASDARRDERVAKVREVAAFPDEYVEQNADRWAGLDEAAFDALVEALAAKAGESSTEELPNATAMTAARESTTETNPVRDVLRMRLDGVDPRTV